MKQLQLHFVGSTNKKHHLTLSDMDPNLSAETIRMQMEKMAGTKLFANEDEQLYVKVQSANYIEQIITPIFEAGQTPVA